MTKYQKIAEELTAYIESGECADRRLPPERELAVRYGVSRQTVRLALELLIRDGCIEKKQGSGIYITDAYYSARNKLALLIENEEAYNAPEQIAYLQQALSPLGYGLNIYETNGRWSSERELLKRLLRESVRGVLSIPVKSALPNPNADLYAALRAKKVPLLFYMGSYANMTVYPAVGEDCFASSYAAAKELFRDLPEEALLSGIFLSDDRNSLARFEAFSEALHDARRELPEERLLFLSTDELRALRDTDRCERLSSYIKRTASEAPDGRACAYFCHNDEIAFFISQQYRSSLSGPHSSSGPRNLSGPPNLSGAEEIPKLVSFDDSYLARLSRRAFISYAPDKRKLAEKAIKMLLEMQIKNSGNPAASSPAIS